MANPPSARITVNGEITHFALKQWIDPNNWMHAKGAAKARRSQLRALITA